MPIVTTSHAHTIGRREVYEDRGATTQVTTPGGLTLTVGIVADGVGGHEAGEVAARIALEATLQHIRTSQATDVPALLEAAVSYANQQVFAETQADDTHNRSMATTLVAAVVHEERVYVANVGDSRVYLVRDGSVQQMTVDHTGEGLYGEVGAEKLLNAIGIQPEIDVDLGLYLDAADRDDARQKGRHGLPLELGDALIVCSDGLYKETSSTGVPAVTMREMADLSQGHNPAHALLEQAKQRRPDDNTTAVVLQYLQKAPAAVPTAAGRGGGGLVLGLGAGVVLLGLVGLLGLFFLLRDGPVGAAVGQTPGAATLTPTVLAAGTSEMIESSGAQRPIGVAFINGQRTVVNTGTQLSSGANPVLMLIDGGEALPASDTATFYVDQGTFLTMDDVINDTVLSALTPGGRVFTEAGAFSGGVDITAADASLSIQAGCLDVRLQPSINTVEVGCYAGVCTYTLADTPQTLPTGEFVTFDSRTRDVIDEGPISTEMVIDVLLLLQSFGEQGDTHIDTCLAAYQPAVEDAEQTIQSPSTPDAPDAPTATSAPPSQPTSQPPTQGQPTATSPPPTATSAPPTATSPPPTATSPAPTATSPPPTEEPPGRPSPEPPGPEPPDPPDAF
jgi:protein phosphatase